MNGRKTVTKTKLMRLVEAYYTGGIVAVNHLLNTWTPEEVRSGEEALAHIQAQTEAHRLTRRIA